MKMVEKITTFCPHCNAHREMKVKLYKKGKQSPFSTGQARYDRKLTGYVGKVKGKKSVKKRAKHQKVMLFCATCKKSTERVIGTRAEKPLEITKVGA